MEKRSWLFNLQWAFLAGLIGALLAYLLTRFTFQLIGEEIVPEAILFLTLVPIAVFIAGVFSWMVVCEFSAPQTITKGTLTGVFIGWVALPLLGAFWMVYANKFPDDAYLFVPQDWTSLLLRSMLYSAWLMIPISGIAGGLLAYFQIKSVGKPAPEEEAPSVPPPLPDPADRAEVEE